MPKKKKGQNRKRDKAKSLKRAPIVLRKVEKMRKTVARNQGTQLPQKEVAARLRKLLADPHIAGIRSTTPQIELISKGKALAERTPIFGASEGNYIFKVSISTRKTRKSFAIRFR